MGLEYHHFPEAHRVSHWQNVWGFWWLSEKAVGDIYFFLIMQIETLQDIVLHYKQSHTRSLLFIRVYLAVHYCVSVLVWCYLYKIFNITLI